MIQTAIETISDGFALFIPMTGLSMQQQVPELTRNSMIWRSQERPFGHPESRRGARRLGQESQAPGRMDIQRLRRHSKPEGLVEYHRNDVGAS